MVEKVRWICLIGSGRFLLQDFLGNRELIGCHQMDFRMESFQFLEEVLAEFESDFILLFFRDVMGVTQCLDPARWYMDSRHMGSKKLCGTQFRDRENAQNQFGFFAFTLSLTNLMLSSASRRVIVV